MRRAGYRMAAAITLAMGGMIASGFAVEAHGFGFPNVVAEAKRLAGESWSPEEPIPEALQQIDKTTYRHISFKPDQEFWSDTRFRLRPIAAGFVYRRPVRLFEIEGENVHPIPFDKSQFDWPSTEFEQGVPANLGFAGFSLSYPIDGQDALKTFMTYLGANQFQAIAGGQVPGAHARGIAVDTGLPAGEQFPAFRKFWLVHPQPNDNHLTIYALLDGQALTGAYQFDISVDDKRTVVHVQANLYPRTSIDRIGLAPMSSMFFYGSAGARPAGQWRPAAYQSDGLLIHMGPGGWVFRSLSNPSVLRTDSFPAEGVRGFGFMQRQKRFCAFEDPVNRFERRPSLWVTTEAGFGKGDIKLVQIPIHSDEHENQIAFFVPDQPVGPDHPLAMAYTLTIGSPDIANEPLGQVQRPLVGVSRQPGKSREVYRVNVDFAGGALDKVSASAPVIARIDTHDTATVLEQAVVPLPEPGWWRLSMLLAPTGGKRVDIDASLGLDQQTLSETWRYDLPGAPSQFGKRQ